MLCERRLHLMSFEFHADLRRIEPAQMNVEVMKRFMKMPFELKGNALRFPPKESGYLNEEAGQFFPSLATHTSAQVGFLIRTRNRGNYTLSE